MAATPDRITPICAHADVCGGCSQLHLQYSDQLGLKARALLDQLGPGLQGLTVPGPSRLYLRVSGLQDPPRHFRQKVSFVFGTDHRHRRLVMGHYRRGSKHIVPVDECPVHNDRGNRIAFALRDHLRRSGIPAATDAAHGLLRHLLVRTTSDGSEAVAMLVVTRNDRSLRGPVRALLDSPDRPDGFFVNINADPGPFMIGPETIRIDGERHIRESIGGIDYLVSPTAFFQTNVHAARVLQQHVVDTMMGADRVLDLYCGSGLFSLPLAARGQRVTAIEENVQAIRDAEANARLNRVPASRARFVAARVEQGIERLSQERWDGVILDPPRQGCSDAVLQAVFQDLRPPRVTYVSCNPRSLAAELGGITQCGYKPTALRAVDMFPHTDHLEAVLTLERAD